MPNLVVMEGRPSKRKRGRKTKDGLDARIEEMRRSIPRGVHYIQAKFLDSREMGRQHDFSHDSIIREILRRELQIQRDKELLEIREVPPDEDSNINTHRLVSARLSIPPQSASKSMTACMDQVAFYEAVLKEVQVDESQGLTLFTPESSVFLSKACEEMILELTCRSYLVAMDAGSPGAVHGQHLVTAVRTSWKTKSVEYSAHGSFDFLTDVIDRDETNQFVEPLDVIGRIHKIN
jgi:hypothetical protein